MLESLRSRVARWIAPPRARSLRSYSGAANSRLTAGFSTYNNSSSDTELGMALTALRSRSRQLIRDASYAKRARAIVVNNVIGSGVGMQAQVRNSRGELHQRINADIEAAWRKWALADSCHTGGTLHFADIERWCMSEVFTAGETFPRKRYRAFGDSRVPFALEMIEAERMADEFTHPQAGSPATRLGVETDAYQRPVAYYVRTQHPGELRIIADQTVRLERVPAAQIIHLRIVDRWPQARGEPWLHTAIRKLADMDGYSEAEIIAARGAASYMGMIETPDLDNAFGEKQSDGTQQLELSPGLVERLGPGEKFAAYTPNRPNTALDPFMRYMLREVAAGIGVSYESLSRDYSQSNYSSSRLALLDDRDLWRVLQQWWIRNFREPIYRDWMQAAVLAGVIPSISPEAFALDPDRFLAVTWKLRGWSWVDPTKEVEAYKEAIRAGLTSTRRVIAQTADGADIEDIVEEIKQDRELFDEAGIVVDTTVQEAAQEPAPEPQTKPADDETQTEQEQAERTWQTLEEIQSRLVNLSDAGQSLQKAIRDLPTAIGDSAAGAIAEQSRKSDQTTSVHIAELAERVRTHLEMPLARQARNEEVLKQWLADVSETLLSLGGAVRTNTDLLSGIANVIAETVASRAPGNLRGSPGPVSQVVADAKKQDQYKQEAAIGTGD